MIKVPHDASRSVGRGACRWGKGWRAGCGKALGAASTARGEGVCAFVGDSGSGLRAGTVSSPLSSNLRLFFAGGASCHSWSSPQGDVHAPPPSPPRAGLPAGVSFGVWGRIMCRIMNAVRSCGNVRHFFVARGSFAFPPKYGYASQTFVAGSTARGSFVSRIQASTLAPSSAFACAKRGSAAKFTI